MAVWILVAILSAAVTYLALNDIKITNNKYVILADKKTETNNKKPWYKIAIGLFCVALITCGVFIYRNYKTNPTQPTNVIKVDINKATEEQLKNLPGIGEVRSKNIIKNRPITDNKQLEKILGQKTYESIKDKVKIGGD